MSSVAPVTAPTVLSGDGRVNAQALDATIADIVDAVNTIAAVWQSAHDGNQRLADKGVGPQTFSVDFSRALQDLINTIAKIRRQYGDNWLPGMGVSDAVIASATVDNSDNQPMFLAVTPADAGLQPVLTIGPADARIYEVKVRLRSVARGVINMPNPAPIGADVANRIYLDAPAVTTQESAGVEVSSPALRILTNSRQLPPVPTADPEYLFGALGRNSECMWSADGFTWQLVPGAPSGVAGQQAAWQRGQLVVVNAFNAAQRFNAPVTSFPAPANLTVAPTWNASAFPSYLDDVATGFGSATQTNRLAIGDAGQNQRQVFWSEPLQLYMMAYPIDVQPHGGQITEYDQVGDILTPRWWFLSGWSLGTSAGGIVCTVHDAGAYAILLPDIWPADLTSTNIIRTSAPGVWNAVVANNLGITVSAAFPNGFYPNNALLASSDDGFDLLFITEEQTTGNIVGVYSHDAGVTWASTILIAVVDVNQYSAFQALVWSGSQFVWNRVQMDIGANPIQVELCTIPKLGVPVATVVGTMPIPPLTGLFFPALMHSRRDTQTVSSAFYTVGGFWTVDTLILPDGGGVTTHVPAAATVLMSGVVTVGAVCRSSDLGYV